MTDRYKHTIQTWRGLAKVYHETFKDIRLYDDSYERFASQLDSNCTILEIGCGPGTVTRWLRRRLPNAEILATDVAPEMIEEAKKHVLGVNFHVIDAREVQSIEEKFDAIFAGFVVPYLAKEDLGTFIDSVAERMNDKGTFYVSCIEKDHALSATQTGSSGHTMNVYYYLEDDLVTLFKHHQLQHLETIRVNYPLPSGESDTHLILIARKH